MPRAIVALGANLGDPDKALREAAAALRMLADGGFAAASIWQSEPVDCPPGSPLFLNSAVVFDTKMSPVSLLDELQRLEAGAGRARGEPNAPRTLDLDLIDMGGLVFRSSRLTLPHPRAAERAFVLAPIAEIDPDCVIAQTQANVQALLDNMDTSGLVRLEAL